jgi:hypothetical protein
MLHQRPMFRKLLTYSTIRPDQLPLTICAHPPGRAGWRELNLFLDTFKQCTGQTLQTADLSLFHRFKNLQLILGF